MRRFAVQTQKSSWTPYLETLAHEVEVKSKRKTVVEN